MEKLNVLLELPCLETSLSRKYDLHENHSSALWT